MEIREILDVMMFVVLCGLLLLGFPVAFSLAGTGLIFAGIATALGVFDMSLFGALPSRIFGNSMTNEVLIAVPLFVFMGVVLERSKVAEELLETMGMLLGSLRGGLGISVTIVGALLAIDGHRWGNRGDHGPVVLANHAAPWVRAVAGLWVHLCGRHAGTDHSTVYRIGVAG